MGVWDKVGNKQVLEYSTVMRCYLTFFLHNKFISSDLINFSQCIGLVLIFVFIFWSFRNIGF